MGRWEILFYPLVSLFPQDGHGVEALLLPRGVAEPVPIDVEVVSWPHGGSAVRNLKVERRRSRG